jgi:hypothetical protein
MQLAGSLAPARGVHRSFAANNAAQDDMQSAGKVKMYAIGEGGCGLCLPAPRELRHTPVASTLVQRSAFSRPPRFFLFRSLSSCRRASRRPGREDLRRIRKVRQPSSNYSRSWRTLRTPRVEVRACWCGTSGTRPSPCRKPAPQSGGGIPCRCIRKWAFQRSALY